MARPTVHLMVPAFGITTPGVPDLVGRAVVLPSRFARTPKPRITRAARAGRWGRMDGERSHCSPSMSKDAGPSAAQHLPLGTPAVEQASTSLSWRHGGLRRTPREGSTYERAATRPCCRADVRRTR